MLCAFFLLWLLGIFSPQNPVNAREQKIPYSWLVFNEKIKVNAVFQQLFLIQCCFNLAGASLKGILWVFLNLFRISCLLELHHCMWWFSSTDCLSMHNSPTGWALKNVWRLSGILHATCCTRNVSELEETAWGADSDQSKLMLDGNSFTYFYINFEMFCAQNCSMLHIIILSLLSVLSREKWLSKSLRLWISVNFSRWIWTATEPRVDIHMHHELLSAVRLLVS